MRLICMMKAALGVQRFMKTVENSNICIQVQRVSVCALTCNPRLMITGIWIQVSI